MDAENRDNGNGHRRSWLPTVIIKLLLPVWEGHMVVSGLASRDFEKLRVPVKFTRRFYHAFWEPIPKNVELFGRGERLGVPILVPKKS